jgi:hypothetical protein
MLPEAIFLADLDEGFGDRQYSFGVAAKGFKNSPVDVGVSF